MKWIGVLILLLLLLPQIVKAEIATVRDWVGLFALGALDGKTTAASWKYTNSCTQTPGSIPKSQDLSGCSFAPPALAGLYEYRLYAYDGETADALLAKSKAFSEGFDFTVAKDGLNWVCTPGNPLSVTLAWPALPAGGVDKVTIVRSVTGESQKTYINPGAYSPGNLTYKDVITNPADSYTYYGIASSGSSSALSPNDMTVTKTCNVFTVAHPTPAPAASPSPSPAPGINCTQSTDPRVTEGLISSSDISSNFGNPAGTCVIDLKAAFAPYKVPDYDTLKSTYFDQSKLGSTQKITLPPGNQIQGSATSPVNLSSSSTGLVGWWKLDEASGTTAADSSGNSRNGTVNGATWTPGKFGNGLNFNSTGMASISNTPGYPITNYDTSRTVTVWFKPNVLGSPQRAILSAGSGSKSGTPLWLLVRKADNKLSIYHGSQYRDSNVTLEANRWYHAAYTFEKSPANTVKLYVDGNLTPVYTGTVADANYTKDNIYIGDGFENNFSGLIDEVKIYNFTMTPDQVHSDYLASVSSSDKLYYITGDLTINNNITVDKTGIIFVDGNLNINTNLTHTSNNAGLVFVVKGDVNIAPAVTEVDAVIISEGSIYTAGAGCATSNVTEASPGVPISALTVNGSLVSLNPVNTIKLCRKLADNTVAAEQIKQQPKYLVILKDLYSDTLQKWSEIQ